MYLRDEIFDVLCNGLLCFFGSKASLFIVYTLNGHKIDGVPYSGNRDDIISMARGNGLAISGQGWVGWDPVVGVSWVTRTTPSTVIAILRRPKTVAVRRAVLKTHGHAVVDRGLHGATVYRPLRGVRPIYVERRLV